uniref:protein-serine/threonine phosphatase n=1 Tax=viral metagenome TaxID=1070528 RepID=A0A6C0B4N9_9ZZZZ
MAALALEVQNSHNIEVTTAVQQNFKGQDQPFFGETACGRRYFGIWDGHGSDSVITELRSYMVNGKLAEFMEETSPVCAVANELLRKNICKSYESSGATMNCGILEGNVLKCINCGDSRMFVFRNGELLFQSDEHSALNEKERARLGDKVTYEKSRNIKMVDKNKIIAVYSEYVQMKNGNHLAVTQALGHNGNLPPFPEVYEIEIGPTDEIVAVSVSDGVTDMLCYDEQENIVPQDTKMLYELSAEELKNKIQERWLQQWTMVSLNGEEHHGIKYEKTDCDDVGITRFVMRPKE